MSEIARVAIAARVFTIVALASLAAVAGSSYRDGAAALTVIAAGATLLSFVRRVPMWAIAVLEGAATAAVSVLVFHVDGTVIPYLVVPALVAGLDRGLRGLAYVLVAEGAVMLGLWWAVVGPWNRDAAATAFTWTITAVGVGVMGVTLRRAFGASTEEASYRSAVALIGRLQALTGRLTAGLDSVEIAEQIIEEAERAVATRRCAVFAQGPAGTVVPLRCTPSHEPNPVAWATELAVRCAQVLDQISDGVSIALPLVVDDDPVGVLVMEQRTEVDQRTIGRLMTRLRPLALQLKAALLFDQVREAAASQERLRIAREVHDGVAQDVASLGYLVDNLAPPDASPKQRTAVAQLRKELSRIVAELRHSIFDLRQVAPPGIGLGESLSAYARQVGSTSDMTVHVTLDENGPRLAAEVEHELMRIAQEAMANARKHSGAQNLWLCCTVQAPYARIEVVDDGVQAHAPRATSQGLKIMRERAEGIGASLQVEEPAEGRGTRVTVSLEGGSR